VAVLGLGALLAVGRAGADTRADALVERARKTAARARSLQAEVVVRTWVEGGRPEVQRGTVQLLRPGSGRVKLSTATGEPVLTLISDGKAFFQVFHGQGFHRKRTALPRGQSFTPHLAEPGALFLGGALPLRVPLAYVGQEALDGRRLQVAEQQTGEGHAVKLYFGPSGLLEGAQTRRRHRGQDQYRSVWLRNIRLNVPLRPAQFAYKPPASYPPATVKGQFIPVGRTAPAFRLPRVGGGEVALADALRGKRVLLINFWNIDCAPCQKELPALRKLYGELKDRGLEVVTINTMDPEDRIAAYLQSSPLPFAVLVGRERRGSTVERQYRVPAYPANYLIGPDGKVRWRNAGFDEEALRRALAAAGVR
jgi:peroxiredoxin